MYISCSVRDAVGGVTERAVGSAGPVAGPGGGVPSQDAAGGAHLPAHTAAPAAPLAGLLHPLLPDRVSSSLMEHLSNDPSPPSPDGACHLLNTS